jgi:hypothetical protein
MRIFIAYLILMMRKCEVNEVGIELCKALDTGPPKLPISENGKLVAFKHDFKWFFCLDFLITSPFCVMKYLYPFAFSFKSSNTAGAPSIC